MYIYVCIFQGSVAMVMTTKTAAVPQPRPLPAHSLPSSFFTHGWQPKVGQICGGRVGVCGGPGRCEALCGQRQRRMPDETGRTGKMAGRNGDSPPSNPLSASTSATLKAAALWRFWWASVGVGGQRPSSHGQRSHHGRQWQPRSGQSLRSLKC